MKKNTFELLCKICIILMTISLILCIGYICYCGINNYELYVWEYFVYLSIPIMFYLIPYWLAKVFKIENKIDERKRSIIKKYKLNTTDFFSKIDYFEMTIVDKDCCIHYAKKGNSMFYICVFKNIAPEFDECQMIDKIINQEILYYGSIAKHLLYLFVDCNNEYVNCKMNDNIYSNDFYDYITFAKYDSKNCELAINYTQSEGHKLHYNTLVNYMKKGIDFLNEIE